MKVLLIEDSVETGDLVRMALGPYEVDQALSLAEASSLIAGGAYNLIIIDVGLPDGNGFQFCAQLSKSGLYENVPKIFLSGHALTEDKIFGLNCGADDYVTKPFSLAELKARVDSRLRQQKRDSTKPQRLDDFEFDLDFQRCFYIQGDEKMDLNLTATEFRLLLLLVKAQGKPLTRPEIVRAIWKSSGLNVESRGIDSHIAHLRKKMEPYGSWVISVYGKGYSFQSQVKNGNRRAA